MDDVMMEPQEELQKQQTKPTDAEFSEELLRIYYARLFPYSHFVDWLSYGKDSTVFQNREFSFTLDQDIYIRYKSFQDKEQLMADMRRTLPYKIDIGAVYTAPPKQHDKINPSEFKPVQRELVFDIDMTDYDDVRDCCDGAKICMKCWSFMTAAIKVLDRALREDFGFKHLLWVYSGRRGVHCWVCDETARLLSNEAREAVVQYLSVYQGSVNNTKKVAMNNPRHPSLDRAFSILEPLFVDWIVSENGQGLLASPNKWEKVLDFLPEDIARALKDNWSSSKCTSSAKAKWEQLKATVEAELLKPKKAKIERKKGGSLQTCIKEIVFFFIYPRLDENVSKGMNHLLKSPFAVHPKTGRVCVPIDPEYAERFDPFHVPTLARLVNELNDFNAANTDALSREGEDWEKTSLQSSIQIFEKTFFRDMRSTSRKAAIEDRERAAAHSGDW